MKYLLVLFLVFGPLSAWSQDFDISEIIPEKISTDSSTSLEVSGALPIRDWTQGIGAHYAVQFGSEGTIFLDKIGAGYQVELSREAYHSRYSTGADQENIPGAIVANAKIKAGYALYDKDGILVGVLGTLGGDIYHVDRETGIAGAVEAGAELYVLSSIVKGKLVSINLLPSQNALQIQSDLIFAVDGKIEFIDNIHFITDFYYGFERAIKRFSLEVKFEKQIPDSNVSAFLGLGLNVANDQHNGKIRPFIGLGVRIALGNKKKKEGQDDSNDSNEETTPEDEAPSDDDFDDDFYDNFPDDDEW